ncbi:hypothetical protein EXE48_14265 [Halorubrum sp. ASP1]|uniref:hypothetical protein n=1 Tax=Halorubrum sp. ASP1 TaxID=2518114 RepID=UPI0010F607B4|nr:hypothetical protein [Halorubrum sp. ASP1]TKX59675.1 hypothetical protein EXE48_14265 [Halorubrum sp. ASP1]
MSRRQGPRTSTDAVEIAILSGVVGVLVTVHFFLPETLHSQFLFTYGEPTVVSAWTAAILHDSVSHLASSVTWYAIVMASAYALSMTWTRRCPFWFAVVGCLVLAPPMTKLGDYWLLKVQWNLVSDATTARGFSGVVSAFGGLLYVSLARTVTARYGYTAGVATTGTIVLGALSALAFTSAVLSPSVAVVLCAIVAFAIGIWIIRNRPKIPTWQAWAWSQRDGLLPIVVGCVVVVVLLSQLFQVQLDETGRFVSVIAHGTGFATGMIVTVLVLIAEYVGHRSTKKPGNRMGTPTE